MGSDSVDPLSEEGLRQRVQNRAILLERLTSLRAQLRKLEREVEEIECTVQGLPYGLRPQSAGDQAVPAQAFGFTANAIAGGIALPLAMSFVHPLDTVRVTMQAALHDEQGFSKTVRRLGLRGFARGFGTGVMWACPQGAIRLGCYERSKDVLAGAFDWKALNVAVSAIAGDLASSVIKVPRELITQQLQVGNHSSALGAVRSLLRKDGVPGLFRGYWSTCFRDAPFMVVLFLSYEQFKCWKIRLTFANHGPGQIFSPWSDAETVLWGGISGSIAAFFTTPLDVVKTRIMTSQERLSFAQALRGVGIGQLFLGAGPRSAWWFCVTSVFFASFERIRSCVQGRIEV